MTRTLLDYSATMAAWQLIDDLRRETAQERVARAATRRHRKAARRIAPRRGLHAVAAR